MGNAFGRQILETTGRSIQVSADGKPLTKAGGITIDWTTIAAQAGSDVTYLDGVLVKVGEKALRYGQVVSLITATGLYGPYDPAAADGRQNAPVRGECYIVNETFKEDEVASNYPPVLEGGLVFLNRIIQSGVAVHTLALGPTLAELLPAFPTLRLIKETN
jgi:hypothetical protein